MATAPLGRAVPAYIYELRRGATGHIARDEPFQVGDQVEIARRPGMSVPLNPQLFRGEVHLIVQLARQSIA